MTDEPTAASDFAALLCSRLCHDLVSPIGAVTNGVELLREETDPEMRAQVQDLLFESSQQASRKLQFYRLAFGSAAGFTDSISLTEAHKAIRALLEADRIEAVFTGDAASASKSMLKIMLNVILLFSEALLRGGRIEIATTSADSLPGLAADISAFTITAEGSKILLSEQIESILSGVSTSGNLDARLAPAALAADVAKMGGYIIAIGREEGRLTAEVGSV